MTDDQREPDQTSQPVPEPPPEEDWLRPRATGPTARLGPRWRAAVLVAAGMIVGGTAVTALHSLGNDTTTPAAAPTSATAGAQDGADSGAGSGPGAGGGTGAGTSGRPGGGGGTGSVGAEQVRGELTSATASELVIETRSGTRTYVATAETQVVRAGAPIALDTLIEGEPVLVLAGPATDDGDLVALRVLVGEASAGVASGGGGTST